VPDHNLDSRKTRAISAMLCSRSVEEAADNAGVSWNIIFRWLREDEHFREEYRKSGSQLMDAAFTRLKQICGAAIETLASIMANGEATAASRAAAAKATLDLTLKIGEHQELVERVERLETSVGKRKSDDFGASCKTAPNSPSILPTEEINCVADYPLTMILLYQASLAAPLAMCRFRRQHFTARTLMKLSFKPFDSLYGTFARGSIINPFSNGLHSCGACRQSQRRDHPGKDKAG
jgi:hypothetical protein